MDDRQRLDRATADLEAPFAVLDLDALRSNAADLVRPYLPAGLSFDPNEGAGEVRTPLLGEAAHDLRIGDRVWFRHAKAGELCERFASLHLIEGDRLIGEALT